MEHIRLDFEVLSCCMFFVLSVTFTCIYPSKYHHIVFTLVYIKGLPSMGICQTKGLYYPGLFILFCLKGHFCVVSLYTKTCILPETCRRAQTKANLWENTFDSYCPTFSHHLPSPSVPSLSPCIQTLLGCRECRQSGRTEINIQLRYEWGLPKTTTSTLTLRERWERCGRVEAWTEDRGNSRKWSVKCQGPVSCF